MRIRLIAIFTALCLLVSFGICLPATAAEQIKIATAEDLIAIASGDLNGNYIQVADIDLKGKSFTAIGSPDAPFTGSYNGNGYKISGMDVGGEGKAYQGLFGLNQGIIRNVTLTADCYAAGCSNVGAIAGSNCGIVEDCISDASVYHIGKTETAATEYTLLSQNLCQWGDDSLASSSNYSDSTSNSRRPGMIQRIRNNDPDFLCFQEVSFAARTRSGKTISGWDTVLKKQLPDYAFVGDYRSNSDKEGVFVAYKTEKFTCLDSGMFWLSDNPDAPRDQQKPAWGASNVRVSAWALLEDNETNAHLVVYSTHLDHVSAQARAKGGAVMAEKMEAIKKIYPDAVFMVAGDYNEEPYNPGYNASDEIFNGTMDDARYLANQCFPDIEYGTYGDINSVSSTKGTIDYIFIDGRDVEVNSFHVLNDYYNNLRPSDHHGLMIRFEALQNNNIGGIVGINHGTVQRVLARGKAVDSAAEAVGQAIGCNSGTATALYSTAISTAIGNGKTNGLSILPDAPSLSLVATLNRLAQRGAFTIAGGEYRVAGNRFTKIPVCLTVNGVDTAVYPGDIYTVETEGEESPALFLNGELLEGTSFIIPQEGGVLNIAPAISSITSNALPGDYVIRSMADWLHLWEHKDFFAGSTIHLLCDLDFSTAPDYTFLVNPGFSFDGHGYTVSNWGTAKNPKDAPAFFAVNEGTKGMSFIKNLNFENCHAWNDSIDATGGSALVYAVGCGNAGLQNLTATFTAENIHVRNCSLGSTSIEASGFILNRYGSPGQYVDVYLKNCSVIGSLLDANNLDHKGLLVGKVRSNESLLQARFFFEDCFVAENEMINTKGACGFVMGSIEVTSIDAYLNNVGVFNNKMSGINDGALICSMSKGGIVVENTICGGNTLSQKTRYIIACHSATPVNVSFTNVQTDAEGYTGVVEGKSISHTPSIAAMESGAAAYAINAALTDPAFYWMTKDGTYLPASKEQQLRKITLRNGAEETTVYANNGTVLSLDSENYCLSEGKSILNGASLTVLDDATLYFLTPVSQVTAAVSGGDFSVSSLEEWLLLYENRAFFRNRKVTVHLLCDIDLKGTEFLGFDDPFFSFDGHNHTISNWGTAEEPAVSDGLFHVRSTLAGGLNYIQNLKFSNVYLTAELGCSAIVYSANHPNAGMANLPSQLTLQNIHIENSTLITDKSEACGMILSRYTPSSGTFTVNITNCTVTDSTLDAGNMDHKGFIVGKIRANNSGSKAVYNLTDCMVRGSTLQNIDGHVGGFVFGSAETNNVTVNLNNVGVIDNTQTNSNAALLGYALGGNINANKTFLADNTVSGANIYLLTTTTYNSISCTGSDVYCDSSLTAGSKYGTLAYTAISEANGAFLYSFNALLSTPSFYWGMEDALPIAVPLANKIAKLTFVNEYSDILETHYLNGGAKYTLPLDSKTYTLINTQGGSIENRVLTMPQGGVDAVVMITEQTCDHNGAALYTPATATTHFRNCANCGAGETENCSFTLLQAESAVPAIGTAFQGCYACAAGCGNTQGSITLLAGDANQSGGVTVADAVYLLRVTAGIIDPATLPLAIGDADNDQSITTADAVLLLQYLIH